MWKFISKVDVLMDIKKSKGNLLTILFRRLVGMAGLVIICRLVLIILIKDENLRTFINDVLSPVGEALIAVIFFLTARFTADLEPRKAESWRLWAFALVIYALGDICWFIFEVVLKVTPFPSVADFFFLLSYIFIWLGLVRYPANKFSPREQKLVGLDNLIVFLGTGLVFWVFLIKPMIVASREVDLLAIMLSVTYPIFDMVFLWTLVTFFRNRLEQSTYFPLILLGLGLLAQIIGDYLFAYQSINGIFMGDASIMIIWSTGLFFFGGASITQVNYIFTEKDKSQKIDQVQTFKSWPLYLPYIWLVVSYSILITNLSIDNNSLLLYLVVGSIVGMVIFRQMLTMSDNARLISKVEDELLQRKRAQDALRQANLELDLRVRERTNDLFTANEQLLQTNQKLEESLHEKEMLLKEIHHRVKNNLQIISSLLSLQANRITDAHTLQTLGDSQARVRSMALIHEKLYQSQSLAKIDFGEYVKSLATDLFRSYQRNFLGIQLSVQVDEVALDLDHAVSCGLILNELMTNALKYAFPDGKSGTIWVELRTGPEQMLSLRVADNGVGIPVEFDISSAKSLGLQLVNSLAAQLDGRIEMERSEGTNFRIIFKC